MDPNNQVKSGSELSCNKMTCTCPNCQAANAGSNEILNSTGKRLHNCHHQDCDQIFDSPLDLSIHLHDKVHQSNQTPQEIEYSCCVCDKIFKQASVLKNHLKFHNPYSSNWPNYDKKFTQETHKTEHFRKTDFMDQICNFGSLRKSDLVNHTKAHMQEVECSSSDGLNENKNETISSTKGKIFKITNEKSDN